MYRIPIKILEHLAISQNLKNMYVQKNYSKMKTFGILMKHITSHYEFLLQILNVFIVDSEKYCIRLSKVCSDGNPPNNNLFKVHNRNNRKGVKYVQS